MRPLALALVLPFAACADTPAPEAPAVPADTSAADTSAAGGARPATDTATITVEGEPQEVALRLVAFDDLSLPFSTYVPEGWATDWTASGEGETALLTMGEPPVQGVVQVFVPSAANRAGLASVARAAAESRGETFPLEETAPWVTEGYAFSGIDEAGRVRLGEHAGVPFYVLEAYPIEMGDGFPPRADLVLDRLRWADDGAALSGPAL